LGEGGKKKEWTLSVFSGQNDTAKVSADSDSIKDLAIIADRVNSPFAAPNLLFKVLLRYWENHE
jgi:hypothetical protein